MAILAWRDLDTRAVTMVSLCYYRYLGEYDGAALESWSPSLHIIYSSVDQTSVSSGRASLNLEPVRSHH